MTLNDYEIRLQKVNKELYIKRYGTSLASIQSKSGRGRGKNHHVCRVPQGEIIQNNSYEVKTGFADQYVSNFNPKGEYRYRLLTRRGRSEVARILYTQGLIPFSAISYLS